MRCPECNSSLRQLASKPYKSAPHVTWTLYECTQCDYKGEERVKTKKVNS